jgi:hypothetical protein
VATTTPPEAVRSELQSLTGEAGALLAVAAAERLAAGPAAVRGALFEAADAIAETYKQAAAELAAGWYDELRSAAPLAKGFAEFVAEPVAVIDRTKLETSVAVATTSLYELIQADIDRKAAEYLQQLDDAVTTSVKRLQAELQKEIASGFRDTITENTERDDAAVGWRRHTRASDSYASGCRWCRFLADKGAIYSKATARFAAHKECHCLASPVFDGDDGPKASVLQYVASKRKRTKAENQKLREHLDNKYGPDPRNERHGSEGEADKTGNAPAGAGGGGQPPADPPANTGAGPGGFGEEPDDPDSPEGQAYWDRRRAALGLDYGADYRTVRPPEIKTVERLQRRGDTLVPIPRGLETDQARNFSSTSDYNWTPAGTTDTFRVEIKSLEDDTRLHGGTFPIRIKKAVGKSKAHGLKARKRTFLVDAGDRTDIPDEVYDGLRTYNRDNPDLEIDRLWFLTTAGLVQIDLD